MGKIPFVITNFGTSSAMEKEIETVSTRIATEVAKQEAISAVTKASQIELESGKRDDTKVFDNFEDIKNTKGIEDVLYVAKDTGSIYIYKGEDESGNPIYEEVSGTDELTKDDIEGLFK